MRKFLVAAAAICLTGLAGCNRQDLADAQIGDAATGPGSAGASAPVANASPALWKTGDADTTVYLFGTVHILPPDLVWQTDPVRKAFGEASVVYFETDIDPNPVEMFALINRVGLYPQGETLSDQLDTRQRQALARAAESTSVSVNSLDRMKPWLAATTLSERLIVKAGFDPMSGVERKLAPMAAEQGKTVRKFETIEQQIMIFAGLPDETQLRYLVDGLESIEEDTQTLKDLVKAWSVGEVEALNRLMVEEELADEPVVYEALLVSRNRNWTEALDRLVKEEPGVFFVAVGAGHLTGKDSVIRMLADKGMPSERIE